MCDRFSLKLPFVSTDAELLNWYLQFAKALRQGFHAIKCSGDRSKRTQQFLRDINRVAHCLIKRLLKTASLASLFLHTRNYAGAVAKIRNNK
ncbi:hypothetical protein DT070_21045 [Polaromonas sp. SP1]|nr:hypothetical protein DT070_21045 [Polaromonas sp. SP1]